MSESENLESETPYTKPVVYEIVAENGNIIAVPNQQAARVPANLLREEPDGPITLDLLLTNQSAYIDDKHLKFDANWGVWIKPNAPITLQDRFQQKSNPSPYMVTRLTDGFRVKLLSSANPHRIGRSHEVQSFQGYIAAKEVK
ncbi:hypothetical protein V5E97_24830 [Singulisphaera sp. Ch08]|uniref:Uncharacterized protein n=1 Tax=Singulisphaera sp. Ch08 TaxID=3120278 RepID=A0AAU7C8E6_9BACT